MLSIFPIQADVSPRSILEYADCDILVRQPQNFESCYSEFVASGFFFLKLNVTLQFKQGQQI